MSRCARLSCYDITFAVAVAEKNDCYLFHVLYQLYIFLSELSEK